MLEDKRVHTFLKLSRQAYGKYKLQILTLTGLGFVTGILEGIGVNALIPLFTFALKDEGAEKDFISRTIESFFTYLDISFTVKYLLIFIITLFVVKAFISVFLNYLKIKITSDYEEQTRSNLFSKTLKSKWPHLLKQKLGHLETILLVDVQASAALLTHISASIMSLTSLIIYVLIAVNISANITLSTLILGCIIFLISKPLVYRIKKLSYGVASTNKEIAHHVNENILGVKTVKSMWMSDSVARKGKEYFVKLKEYTLRISLLKSTARAFIQPISLIFVCLIFAFSYKSPVFNFAALVAIIYLIQKIFAYIQQLQGTMHAVSQLLPHLRSVLDYEQKAEENVEQSQSNLPFKFDKKLQLNHVAFGYSHDKKVLSNIDFTVNRGDLIGIIGPSGVGKTTLVDLILRLFNPTKGNILLDDVDISKIDLSTWRKSIGYVSQDMFLINDTIENNIRFYNQSITKKDIVKAAKMANIDNFIESTQDKYKTVIGERGVLLSAGQRQRIVIARVLATNPQILILDEATSALDNESELRIQEVISKLKGKITVLVIAHRLSTVIDMDQLIVLDKGKIQEQGKPQHLLKDKDSYFARMYNLRN